MIEIENETTEHGNANNGNVETNQTDNEEDNEIDNNENAQTASSIEN